MKTVGILVAFYNEEDTIIPFLNSLEAILSINKIESVIFLINDGSVDNSENLVREYMKTSVQSYSFVSMGINQGQQLAFKTLLQLAPEHPYYSKLTHFYS